MERTVRMRPRGINHQHLHDEVLSLAREMTCAHRFYTSSPKYHSFSAESRPFKGCIDLKPCRFSGVQAANRAWQREIPVLDLAEEVGHVLVIEG